MNKIISYIERNIKQPLWENWYITRKLGTGSFSAVYQIEAKRNTRTDKAAMKIEPITADDTLFSDDNRKKSFIENKKKSMENESTIMRKLRNCPNIVAYEDENFEELVINGKFEGYYFLIRMELLQCVSDLIKKDKMDLSEANIIRLAKHIGRGIKAAHDIGVIHRDIKPGNFFLSEDGLYKLGDFNISKQSDTARTFAGTNGYLAPEIYRSKTDIDECYTNQADIYSFGICLYQLMNNLYLPFEDRPEITDTNVALSMRLKGEALPFPKNASPAFGSIILKACAYSTQDRYKTIDQMLYDLFRLNSKSFMGQTGSIPVQNAQPQQRPAAQPDMYSTQYAADTSADQRQGTAYQPQDTSYQPQGASYHPQSSVYQPQQVNNPAAAYSPGSYVAPANSADNAANDDHTKHTSKKALVIGVILMFIGVFICSGVLAFYFLDYTDIFSSDAGLAYETYEASGITEQFTEGNL